MAEMMDVSSSLRKIARELYELDVSDQENAIQYLAAASYLIKYIADGLDAELAAAAVRAHKLQRRQLGMAE